MLHPLPQFLILFRYADGLPFTFLDKQAADDIESSRRTVHKSVDSGCHAPQLGGKRSEPARFVGNWLR